MLEPSFISLGNSRSRDDIGKAVVFPGEVLRTLLDAKADQQPDAHGVTPLCAAAAAKPWLLTMSQGAGPGPSGSPKQYQVRRSGNNLKAVRTLSSCQIFFSPPPCPHFYKGSSAFL